MKDKDSDGALRIFVDVSSSYGHAMGGYRKTGIQRVESEIARVLVGRNHKAVVWVSDLEAYREIPVSVIATEGSRPRAAEIEEALGAPQDATDTHAKDIVRLRCGLALSLIFPNIGTLRTRFMIRLAALFGRVALALPIAERRVVARRLKLNRRVERANHFLMEFRIAAASRLEKVEEKADFQAGDVLLVLPLLTHSRAHEHFLAMAQRGIRIVPLIYDLYSIRSPHATVSRDSDIAYAQCLALISHVSDLVLTISNWTARDVVAWYAEQNLRAPRIVPIPLAAGLRPSDIQPTPPKNFPFPAERFVLLSGSFSSNKNQYWAHMLWSRLYERLGSATWPLVFAGGRGYKQEETIWRLQRDARYGSTLYWVDAPSDGELAWLYTYCAFNIVPSEFEGWGLPLSEALAFGKPCLSSGLGALREAGQGIVWERDPIDGVAWLDQCARWMTDSECLAAEQARVRRNYRPRTWKDVTDDIVGAIRQNVAS